MPLCNIVKYLPLAPTHFLFKRDLKWWRGWLPSQSENQGMEILCTCMERRLLLSKLFVQSTAVASRAQGQAAAPCSQPGVAISWESVSWVVFPFLPQNQLPSASWCVFGKTGRMPSAGLGGAVLELPPSPRVCSSVCVEKGGFLGMTCQHHRYSYNKDSG